MARLNDSPISASQQFRAIAYLRWRLFANAFRRKGGAGELAARIVVYPIGLLFLVGPTFGAGFGAWAAVSRGHLQILGLIFWIVTAIQVFVSINLSPQGLSFDPVSLIRFPIAFPRYLIVRLFLGLLAPSTIVGTCALLAAAAGTAVARPELALIAFAAAILLAIVNMLFIRMIFAWVDRWLSTRRARELFTGLIIFFSVGIQWLNLTFNPGFAHRSGRAASLAKLAALHRFYHSAQAILGHFPAGLAGITIVDASRHAPLYTAGNLIVTALFGTLFLAVFAWRMHLEYRGENTSDSARNASVPVPHRRPSLTAPGVESAAAFSFGSPVLTACFLKEWVYIQRNTTQFFALLVPLAMVFLFAGKLGANRGTFAEWTFPIAVVYATLGVAALAYNSLGLDAEGIQLYFIAPIRFRTVMLAKNLFGFVLLFAQTVIIYVVLSCVATRPPLLIAVATLIWLLFAILANVTLGNMRSILAPKKMDPNKLSRRQTSQLSALLSVLAILVLGAIGAGVFTLGEWFELPWLPIPIFLALAALAAAGYVLGLNRIDALAQSNRETLIEELCKAS